MKKAADKGKKINFDKEDPNNVAGFLKLWLRELPTHRIQKGNKAYLMVIPGNKYKRLVLRSSGKEKTGVDGFYRTYTQIYYNSSFSPVQNCSSLLLRQKKKPEGTILTRPTLLYHNLFKFLFLSALKLLRFISEFSFSS